MSEHIKTSEMTREQLVFYAEKAIEQAARAQNVANQLDLLCDREKAQKQKAFELVEMQSLSLKSLLWMLGAWIGIDILATIIRLIGYLWV